jgi:hypothetical protein
MYVPVQDPKLTTTVTVLLLRKRQGLIQHHAAGGKRSKIRRPPLMRDKLTQHCAGTPMIANFVRRDLLCPQQHIQGSLIIVKPCIAAGNVDQEASPPFSKTGGKPTKIHFRSVPDSFPGASQLYGHSHLVDRHISRTEDCAEVGTVFIQPIGADSRRLERSERFPAVAAACASRGGAQQCRAAKTLNDPSVLFSGHIQIRRSQKGHAAGFLEVSCPHVDLRKTACRCGTAEHVVRLLGELDRSLGGHPGYSRAVCLYQGPACNGVDV